MSSVFQRNAFDIFPLVFPVAEAITFTVQTLGTRNALQGEYTVTVHRALAGSPNEKFTAWNTDSRTCQASNGKLQFSYTASQEGEYFIRLYQNGTQVAQLHIYALNEDLACRYPLRGDFHVHTSGSDGQEPPEIVCANYRRKGYDFIVITDHFRYYPSLNAINAYQDVDIPLTILPGEEIHLPGTPVHIVNAGGLFSINGLFADNQNYTETNGDISKRRLNEGVEAPDIYAMPKYWEELQKIEDEAKQRGIPESVDSLSYAGCCWAFDKIREADGLGIFCHPYWIQDLFQIPEEFTLYMLQEHPFDAFEVLGGENYYAQNGLQTALYYDEYLRGRVHPIVGSTDSHGSTASNRNWDICSTIVFAKANERRDILNAVKEKYSVAVDTISKEYRLVGEYRLQKYASFLMERYFPIHDQQTLIDGELMYQYAIGNADKTEVESVGKRAESLLKKYIAKKL